MRRSMYDLLALLVRVGVGGVFIAHGWQKITDGIDATAGTFRQMGVPYPSLAAGYSTFVELIGGAALVLGLALPLVGLLLAVDMAGAFAFVHVENGIFVTANGFELVLVLGLASLLLGFGAAGRLTLDGLIFGRRRARRAAEEAEEVEEGRAERAEPVEREVPAERDRTTEETAKGT